MSISNWTQVREFLRQDMLEKETQIERALDIIASQPACNLLRDLALDTLDWWLTTRIFIESGKRDDKLPKQPVIRDKNDKIWAYDISVGQFTMRRPNEDGARVTSPVAFNS